MGPTVSADVSRRSSDTSHLGLFVNFLWAREKTAAACLYFFPRLLASPPPLPRPRLCAPPPRGLALPASLGPAALCAHHRSAAPPPELPHRSAAPPHAAAAPPPTSSPPCSSRRRPPCSSRRHTQAA